MARNLGAHQKIEIDICTYWSSFYITTRQWMELGHGSTCMVCL
jgi:hypothetical protein